MTRHLNAIFTALIIEVERFGGSVIGFAGDAITCWFDDAVSPAASRAVRCGLALQAATRPFSTLLLADKSTAVLTLKVAIATGPARRFVVGDLDYQYLDTLAGATIARMAAAEHLAAKGEVLIDEATAQAAGDALVVQEWRTDLETDMRFGLVQRFTREIAAADLPELPMLDSALWQTWLHRAVYEREQAGQTAFLTEFRPCTALFVRFGGIDYDADEAEAHTVGSFHPADTNDYCAL